MYRFPWYLTLVSTNHASSNPGQDVSEMTGHHLNEGGQSIILIALLNILLCSSLRKRRSFKVGYPLKASIPLQRIRGIKSLNFVSLLVDVSH